MSSTRAQLATAVLRDNGLLSASESPTDADSQYIIGAYDKLHAMLQAPGMEYVYWAPDEIPDAVFIPLRDLVWNEVRTSFGMPLEPDQKRIAETTILSTIRRHVQRDSSALPVKALYY
jgi:hypothetical protein